MLFKKYLGKFSIQLKTMKKMAFLPLVVLFGILLPLFIRNCLYGSEQGRDAILMMANLLIPLFSTWWVLMFLREFLESDGNEILFVYGKKSQIGMVMSLTALYLLCQGALLGMCCIVYPELLPELLRLTLTCMFLCGFTYFFSFLTRSAAISFLPALLYTALPFLSNKYLSYSFFMVILLCFILPALFGGLFFGAGHVLNTRFAKYN